MRNTVYCLGQVYLIGCSFYQENLFQYSYSVYSRWQVQCKNNTKTDVTVDVIAKGVGLTFRTQANIIMVVTTTKFTSDAVNFANQVTNNSRYYIILLEGEDVRRIAEDRTRIVDILNAKARRAFAKRELGFTEFDEELLEEEELETEEELEKALREATTQMPRYEEGWVLISDRPASKSRLSEYARRMRVEATFQDTKRRGWDLEVSLIVDKERLHRLLLGLFVAIWWVSHLAALCIHHGHRSRFDRADRRDKSIFRLVRLWFSFILKHVRDSAWGIANLTHSLPFCVSGFFMLCSKHRAIRLLPLFVGVRLFFAQISHYELEIASLTAKFSVFVMLGAKVMRKNDAHPPQTTKGARHIFAKRYTEKKEGGRMRENQWRNGSWTKPWNNVGENSRKKCSVG